MYKELASQLEPHGFACVWSELHKQVLGLPIFFRPSRVKPVLRRQQRLGGSAVFPFLNQRWSLQKSAFSPIQQPALSKWESLRHHGVQVRFEMDVAAARPVLLDIANTHLFWDDSFGHLQCMQAVMLTNLLASPWLPEHGYNGVTPSSDQLAAATGTDVPLVLCGDFNSLPVLKKPVGHDGKVPEGVQSGVYEYLTTGRLAERHPHHFSGYYSPDTPAAGVPELVSPLGPLNSAYKTVLGAEPRWTNFVHDFKETLDYLFYGPTSRVVPIQVLDIPSEAALTAEDVIPSSVYPSDHLPVSATFFFPG